MVAGRCRPRPRLALRQGLNESALRGLLSGRSAPPEGRRIRRADAHDGFRPAASAPHPVLGGDPGPAGTTSCHVARRRASRLVRFHNRVVDTLPAATPAAVKFMRARKTVTRHYQWMIKTDFLPRICDPAVVNDVFKHGRRRSRWVRRPPRFRPMPIEFSIAAYRLGHCMVRAARNWNINLRQRRGHARLPVRVSRATRKATLGVGNNRLPFIWIADFRRLYNFGQAGRSWTAVVPAAKFHCGDADRSLQPCQHPPWRRQATIGPPKGADEADPRRSSAVPEPDPAKMVNLATGPADGDVPEEQEGEREGPHGRTDPPGRLATARLRSAGLVRPSATPSIARTPLLVLRPPGGRSWTAVSWRA